MGNLLRVKTGQDDLTALLTKQEELELTTIVQRWQRLERLAEDLEPVLGRPPTTAEWSQAAEMSKSALIKHILEGRQAKAVLITHNLKLVLSLAHRYSGRGGAGLGSRAGGESMGEHAICA